MLTHILPAWPWYVWTIGWCLLLICSILEGAYRVMRHLSPTVQQLALDNFATRASLTRMDLYRWGGDHDTLKEAQTKIRTLKSDIGIYLQDALPGYWSDIFDTSLQGFESSVDLGDSKATACVAYLDRLTERLATLKNHLRPTP